MPRVKGDDTLTWKLNRYGVFDVCSYYNFLAVPDGSLLSLSHGNAFGV